MKKLTRQEIEEKMDDEVYFSNINFIVRNCSPLELKLRLKQEPKSEQLNASLVYLLHNLEILQAFELCCVVRDYLIETSK